MSRILPDDVVAAYQATGAIPIRMAWITKDARGGCAIDTVARHLGVCTEDLRKTLDKRYEDGFLVAWDSDVPTAPELVEQVQEQDDESFRRGYCDGLMCRQAVEKQFSSEIPAVEAEQDS